jgi:peptidoglycan/xylan/chitin deacetylase (PgdA/CDA1 family)
MINRQKMARTTFWIVIGTLPLWAAPKVVILKLDDLKYQVASSATFGAAAGWSEATDFLDSAGIKAGLGIISETLASASPEYIQFIKGQIAKGHELWHHGLDHQSVDSTKEFCGHPLAFQKQHFQDAVDLVKAKIGVTMKSFGAPYNCSDAVFTQVFEAQSDVKVFMYPNVPAAKNAFPLLRTVDMEITTGQPDWATFTAGYAKYPKEEYYCLQGHPAGWAKGSIPLEAFKKIVLFLKSEGVTFMTPYQYFAYKSGVGIEVKLEGQQIHSTTAYLGTGPVPLFMTSVRNGISPRFALPELFNAKGQKTFIQP